MSTPNMEAIQAVFGDTPFIADLGILVTLVDSRVFQADGESDRLVAIPIVTLAIRQIAY